MISKKLRLCLSLPVLAMATACASTHAYSVRDSSALEADGSVSSRQHIVPVAATPGRKLSGYKEAAYQIAPKSRQTLQIRNPTVGTQMGIGPSDFAPAGLQEFCNRLTAECGIQNQYFEPLRQSNFVLTSNSGHNVRTERTAPARAIHSLAWTRQNQNLVSSINRQVNRSMIGTTDAEAFGRYEYWAMPISDPSRNRSTGRPLADCEDFALEKRRALISAGIPEDSLYLAVAFTAGTGMHAVLIISTDSGDIVLDNLNDWLIPWSRTGYVWIKRQSTTSLLDWSIAGRAIAPNEAFQFTQIAEPYEPKIVPIMTVQLAEMTPPRSSIGNFVTQNALRSDLIDSTPQHSTSQYGLRGFISVSNGISIVRAVGQEQATSNVLPHERTKLKVLQTHPGQPLFMSLHSTLKNSDAIGLLIETKREIKGLKQNALFGANQKPENRIVLEAPFVKSKTSKPTKLQITSGTLSIGQAMQRVQASKTSLPEKL